MTRLELHFDIPDNKTFEKAREAVVKHLTPKKERVSLATLIDLERSRQQLEKSLGSGEYEYRLQMDRSHATYFANDLDLPGSVEEVDMERYWAPLGSGTPLQTVEIFGKQVGGIGDYPLTIRVTDDATGIGDRLYLLKSWRDRFVETGGNIGRDIKETIDGAKGVAPEFDALLAGLPRTEEGFNLLIADEENRVNTEVAVAAVSLVRFTDDFFGRPLRGIGLKPRAAEVKGPSGFEMLIDPEVIEDIVGFPTIELSQALKRIIPVSPDDLLLVGDQG